jgi:hypothetical protein
MTKQSPHETGSALTPRADWLAREHQRIKADCNSPGVVQDWIALAQKLERDLAEESRDGMRYRWLRADYMRANRLAVVEYFSAPPGVKRFLDLSLDDEVDKGLRGELPPLTDEEFNAPRAFHGVGVDTQPNYRAMYDDVMALKAQVERQLVQACAIGMSTILVRCGAYDTLSPYLRSQYDELARLHRGVTGDSEPAPLKATLDKDRKVHGAGNNMEAK